MQTEFQFAQQCPLLLKCKGWTKHNIPDLKSAFCIKPFIQQQKKFQSEIAEIL